MNADKLKALAAQGSLAFLAAVPRLVLGALAGAALGLVILGGVGALLAFGSAVLWRGSTVPAWLTASLFLTPVVLALAGLYVGAVRGFLSALAEQLVQKKLVAYLYAQVKPAALAAMKRANGAEPAQLAEELRTQLASAPEEKPGSFSDRVAHFITMNSRRVLALSVVAHVARAKSGSEAAAEVEKLGVAKLEDIVVGQLEDLFSLQLTLITGGALLVCLLPQLGWWLF
jgi:hypothetical protein